MAFAARKGGKWPSGISLLVVLMCEPLLHLQSKRISRGSALQVQSSEHLENADWGVADGDETLLACVVSETKKKIVIPVKDKAFWEYYYAKGQYFNMILASLASLRTEKPRSLNCKAYTQPPKPAATLKNLTTHALAEEMIDLIASFDNSDLHCTTCGVTNFKMDFLEKCNTVSDGSAVSEGAFVEQFQTVEREVKQADRGVSCRLATWVEIRSGQGGKSAEHTLQSCMELNSYLRLAPDMRVLAACEFESDSETQTFIEKKEEKIRDLQTIVDLRKQDVVYTKHIFDGL